MTPILKNSNGNTAVFIKAKEALVRRSAFLKLLLSLVQPPVMSSGFAHTKIIEDLVAEILIIQVITKVLGLDKIYL